MVETRAAVVVINQSKAPRDVTVPVWMLDVPEDAMMLRVIGTTPGGYNIGRAESPVEDGELKLTLQEESAVLYLYRY